MIDETTRECLAIEVARSFTAQDVIGVLQYLFAVRGTPQHVRSDNGPEFVAKIVRRWLQRADVGTLFIYDIEQIYIKYTSVTLIRLYYITYIKLFFIKIIKKHMK